MRKALRAEACGRFCVLCGNHECPPFVSDPDCKVSRTGWATSRTNVICGVSSIALIMVASARDAGSSA